MKNTYFVDLYVPNWEDRASSIKKEQKKTFIWKFVPLDVTLILWYLWAATTMLILWNTYF